KYALLICLYVVNLVPFLYLMYNVSLGNNMFTFLNNHPFTEGVYGMIDYILEAIDKGVNYINEGN
ncbi:hypothetical protein FQS71_005247, partial [Escherichia coli]|nr:hypothetical protein [Escherichia coli]